MDHVAAMAYLVPGLPAPPDARWHRAVLLAEGHTTRGGRDPWVRRALRFIRRPANAPRQRAKRGTITSDVAAAHAVYASGDRLTRGTLEAWLLTGLSMAEVATECGTTAGVVAAYRALFFDPGAGPQPRARALNAAIGAADPAGVTEGDVDRILKRAALVGGRFVLEQVLGYYRHGCSVPADPGDLTAGDLTRLRERLLGRTLVLTWVLPFERLHRVAVLQNLGRELDALIAARVAGSAAPVGRAWDAFGRAVEAASTGAGSEDPGDPWAALELCRGAA
jgi:hypothetical protein